MYEFDFIYEVGSHRFIYLLIREMFLFTVYCDLVSVEQLEVLAFVPGQYENGVKFSW